MQVQSSIWITGFEANTNVHFQTFLTPRIRKPLAQITTRSNFDSSGWLRNYFTGSDLDLLTRGKPYADKPWSQSLPHRTS